MSTGQASACSRCVHFRGTATELEALLPGLRTLSSAYGSVRSQDGVCHLHQRYVAADASCSAHVARSGTFC
jgi:hypothetical protein